MQVISLCLMKKSSLKSYLGFALLFQSFFKFALGREIWNVVDMVVLVALIGSLFYNKQGETYIY